MTTLGSYRVSVQTRASGPQTALLTPARLEDMPTDWTFNWPGLWQLTDFDCQNIVKLVYSEQVWGLVRYGLYPYPGSSETLEIEHLETNPASRGQQTNRLIEPIGKWLIWYATQVGLQYCSGGLSDTPILLVSLEDAFTYYRDIVSMQYLGQTTIAPGEDGYVFSFSRTGATAFCLRQEREWGFPTPFNP
ncbi:hypothetical protein [Argonema antarcticum]|uniref:hypothetical protein n=1 Tax=Argonema antarcticum TaxID=2942763 RepID=UPI002011DF62|nr:hypothetical protein [Argonema antarcticum]MCL1472004.1 hypothetical protein [Argonema antarcticum A004/B2]